MSEADKFQPGAAPTAAGLAPNVIVSPDTERAERVPPGQSRTRKWPVLDAAGAPAIELDRWRLELGGLVERAVSLTFAELCALPQSEVFADFHCVTRWSRLGNLWRGVSTRTLVELCGTIDARARHVLVHGYDYGWTTNLPLEWFLAEDSLVATHHDGEPLSAEHGGPARLIVPRLYAWKSAKWIGAVDLIERDEAGFWERNGYHMIGDPWKEERFGD